MGKILFGIHNHQPVDNFHKVVERAIDRSYLPFIKEAEKHPKFKFSLHFSGWLFNYVKEKREGLFKVIKKLVERGQVELFTGGYYEPILPSIPSSYRRAQIEKLNSFIKENFGITPKGLWLAERVWDEEIVKDLVECGIEYVVVDDYHFICAGFKREELNGYFLTENQGYSLKVYPIDNKLRYLIPFKNLGEIEKYLKGAWGTKVLFDDGEKFGLWPGTYRWVYEEGWLKGFFKAFEEGVLEGELFSENSTKEKPLGIAYLPTCSYYEMGMWSLPTDRYIEITKLKETLRKLGVEEEEFIRGSIWKNFFNLAYQGIFPKETIEKLNLGWELFHMEALEFWGKVNFLKGGIVFSDAVNTVSPTYAKEIMTPEFGFGLNRVLRKYSYKLFGILNGIDYDVWNPETDPFIYANYSDTNIERKEINKEKL